jgi:Flp pilus assembly protein TadG
MNPLSEERNPQKGAVMLLVAGGAVAMFGMLALAIDVGYIMTTRAELKNAADAGAMSANRELARIYDGLGNVDRKNYTLTSGDKSRIQTAANTYMKQNKAAGVAITLGSGDVEYGRWNKSTGAVTASSTGVNAVTVTARREAASNGSVATIFGSILGVDSFQARAASAAALTAVSEVPAGTADIPVGIAKAWFTAKDSPCGSSSAIRFYPTGTTVGCAGWHTFDSWPANASKLKTILNGLQSGTFTAPAIKAGVTEFVFIGGTVASRFSDMQALYNAKKDATGSWMVQIPVYDQDNCSNPNGKIKIIGLATARITGVRDAPAKEIDATVECDVIPIGKGGGSDYGTLVSAPTVIR